MERCELCALPLDDEHPHLFDRERHTIVCACHACATLFDMIDAARYRRIRTSVRRLDEITLDDASWSALGVPVGLAFLIPQSSGDIYAAYPGPAGPTTAIVDRAAWDAVTAGHPALRDLEPDVEAWLVNRLRDAPVHYRVSIDHCYRLAGMVRSRWKGIGGGPEVAAGIAEFFQTLEADAA
ncbi:MAG: DUF5947 family protein [Gemmatimonadales bacterium]